jgi:hypothetical protein
MTPVVMPEERRDASEPDPVRSEIRTPEADCQPAPYAFDFEGVVRRALESSTSIDPSHRSAASSTAGPIAVRILRSPRRSVRARWWVRFLSFRRSG